jgi:3-dehydroquinate synthase
MKTIKVDLGKRSYNINIGKGIIYSTGKIIRSVSKCRACFVVSNKDIADLYSGILKRSLIGEGLDVKCFNVAGSESAKSCSSWLRVIRSLARFDKGKGACLVSLGGGVVGDLGGFAAATYRRGIDFVQIPTTLLAQVDAAIGGKAAIDLDFAKNLVGAFYQPRAVISDIGLLKTLPVRQIRNGLSEVIKYAVVFDETLFSYLEKHMADILRLNPRCLEYIISRCSRIKAKVVSIDELEQKGYRSMLNFGHTIGHAIESASSYSGSIHHGEAVAIGMSAAFDISVSIGMARASSAERFKGILKAAGLGYKINRVSPSRVLAATLYDKKTTNGIRRWVLPERIGHGIVCSNVPAGIIRKAVLRLY